MTTTSRRMFLGATVVIIAARITEITHAYWTKPNWARRDCVQAMITGNGVLGLHLKSFRHALNHNIWSYIKLF